MVKTNDQFKKKRKPQGLATPSVTRNATRPPTAQERARVAAGKLIEKDPAALDKWIRALKGKPRG